MCQNAFFMNNRWHYFKVRRSNNFESWSRVFRLARLGFISLRDAHECVSCKVFSMINHTLRGLPIIDVTVAKHVRLRQAGDAQKGPNHHATYARAKFTTTVVLLIECRTCFFHLISFDFRDSYHGWQPTCFQEGHVATSQGFSGEQ